MALIGFNLGVELDNWSSSASLCRWRTSFATQPPTGISRSKEDQSSSS